MKVLAILANLGLFGLSLSLIGNSDYEYQGLVAGILMISPAFCTLAFTACYLWPWQTI